MTTGEMRTRITFLSTTYTQDEYSSTIAVTETLATVWGKVEYSSGNNFQQTGAGHWRQRIKITIRENPVLNTRLIVFFDGLKYAIDAIEPVQYGKAKYLVLRLGAEVALTSGDGEGNSSTGGDIGIGDADAIGSPDPVPSGRFYSVFLHNVLITTMSFYFDKKAAVDWGDGTPVKQYPGNHIVNKTYAIGDGPIELKVWWEVEALNPCREMYIQSGGGGNTAVIDSVGGDFPVNLWRFQVSNSLAEFPFAKIPDSITYVNVNQASLSTIEINGILQMFIDKNVTNGLLKIKQNPPVTDFDRALLQAVEDLGTVVEYDV